MKLLSLRSTVALVCLTLVMTFAFTACRKHKDETPTLSVNQTTISAGGPTQSYPLSITSNQAWRIVVPEAAKDWITVTPTSGTGDAPVQVEVKENSSGVSRTAELKLEAVGNTPAAKAITVTQKSYDYTTTFSKVYGGDNVDLAQKVIAVAGGFVTISSTLSNNSGDVGPNQGSYDIWVIKTDESGNVVWKTLIGGNDSDDGSSIAPTADGGFLVVGTTRSKNLVLNSTVQHGNSELLLVKLNAIGATQWQKTYGGSDYDYGQFITPTPDGDFVVGGNTSSIDGDLAGTQFKGSNDMWLLKVRADGTKVWSRTYGGSLNDYIYALHASTDGYYAIGYTESTNGDLTGAGYHGGGDLAVLKLDPVTGALSWIKALGGSQNDYIDGARTSIAATSDGLVITGTTSSTNGDLIGTPAKGLDDIWVMKLSFNGMIVWQSRFGGTNNDYASAIVATPNGFVVNGSTRSTDGDVTSAKGARDAWILQLNLAGKLLWQKNYGNSFTNGGNSLVTTSNGILFAGSTDGDGGDISGYHGGGGTDVWLMRLTEK